MEREPLAEFSQGSDTAAQVKAVQEDTSKTTGEEANEWPLADLMFGHKATRINRTNGNNVKIAHVVCQNEPLALGELRSGLADLDAANKTDYLAAPPQSLNAQAHETAGQRPRGFSDSA
jgi:hypothetical protein